MTVPPFDNRAVRGRVLLLERSSLLREVQQLLLRSAGYETVATDDPAVALGELDLHRFDVVLLDATHREYAAADFVVMARRVRPISIIAVAWHPGTLTPSELLDRGIDRVLESPGSASVIIAVVDEVLGFKLAPAAPAMAESLATPAGVERVRIRVSDRVVEHSASTSTTGSRTSLAVDDVYAP